MASAERDALPNAGRGHDAWGRLSSGSHPAAVPVLFLHLLLVWICVCTSSKAMLQAARALQCGRPLVGLSLAPRWLSSSPAAAKIKVGGWELGPPAGDVGAVPRVAYAPCASSKAPWSVCWSGRSCMYCPQHRKSGQRPAAAGAGRRSGDARMLPSAPVARCAPFCSQRAPRACVPCCRARKCWASPWM